MGLLDLFKKKKFDDTDLKSITYKRYWLDSNISTILIPIDWEVSNTDRFSAKSVDDTANLSVMSSEEPLKGEINKQFFENLKGDFFKDYEREGFTALDETTANERYISKTFRTYDEVEYHFTCAKKLDDKAIITEIILRHKEPYSLEVRELVDKIGMSIQYVADFTRLFAERLVTKNPNIQVRKTKGLEIEWMLKSEPGQLITSFLDNAYAEYMHRSDFYLSEIIEKYASSILETIPKEKPKAPEKPKEEPIIVTPPAKETPKQEAQPTPADPVTSPIEMPATFQKEKEEKVAQKTEKETLKEKSPEETNKGKEPIFPDISQVLPPEKTPQEELPAKKTEEKDTHKVPVFPDINDFVPEAKASENSKEDSPIEVSEELKAVLDLAVNLESEGAFSQKQEPATVASTIEEQMYTHLEAEEVITGKLVIKKEEIFPLVRTRAFVEELKGEIPDLLYETINSELAVIYLIRNEKTSLTSGDLKDLMLDPLAVKALAVQNLIDQIEVGVDEEGGRYTLVADGKFEASFLVVSELWSKDNIPVEGTIIIGVPANNVLLITGSANPSDMNWIRHRVAQAYVESNIPISDKLFEIKGNTLIPIEM